MQKGKELNDFQRNPIDIDGSAMSQSHLACALHPTKQPNPLKLTKESKFYGASIYLGYY